MPVSPTGIGAVFGGEKHLGGPCRTWSDLQALLESGLPKRAVKYFADKYVGSISTLVELISLELSHCDYEEKPNQILRVAKVAALAESLTGTASGAREFLIEPHVELCGKSPLQVAITELGVWRCEELLDRAASGIPL